MFGFTPARFGAIVIVFFGTATGCLLANYNLVVSVLFGLSVSALYHIASPEPGSHG